MFRYRKLQSTIFALAAALALALLPSCSAEETPEVVRDMPSAYAENGLKIYVKNTSETSGACKISSADVTVTGLRDKDVQRNITDRINLAVNAMESLSPPPYRGIAVMLSSGSTPKTIEISVDVKANFGNLLSLLINKKSSYSGIGGITQLVYDTQTLNINVKTGEDCKLPDLFLPEFDAMSEINHRFYNIVAINSMNDEHFSNRIESLGSAYLVGPFTGLGDSPKFVFDSTGITFYLDYATPEFYTIPGEQPHITIPYDEPLFYNLTIFDAFPDTDTYESVLTNKHLVSFPSDQSMDYEANVDGLKVKAREILPTTFASPETADRVAKLRPSIEDASSQATGVGGEYYYYYFYANRVGRFMVVRLAEETYAGMNSYVTDRNYVFDAKTGANLPVSSLFSPNYDYVSSLAKLLVSREDFRAVYAVTEEQMRKILMRTQFLPRLDGFILRASGVSMPSAQNPTSILTDFYFRLDYSDIGYKNLLIYE